MLRGKYLRTEETREKLRQANLGKKLSEETKRKISLSNARGFFGKKHSEETRKKMSKSHAIIVGDKNPRWKGGRINNGTGYIFIYSPEHPYCNNRKYVFEHRLVMEKHLGRYLKPEERVHHKNSVLNDNRIENLTLFANNGEHTRYHESLKVNNYDKRRNYCGC